MSVGLFKIVIYKIYMYKQDYALNNPQRLICHKNPNQTKPNQNS